MAYGSSKTSGGGTQTQLAAGTPGMTPGGGGPGGTRKTYSGQPSATGEMGTMGGGVDTPNQLQCNSKEKEHFPYGKG